MPSEHPNIARIRRGFEAFVRGDLSELDDLIVDDVEWHQPGNHVLAGDYHGKGELLQLFVRIHDETGGTVRTEVKDVWADDTHAVVLSRSIAERLGRHQDSLVVQIFRLTADGRLAERWALSNDQDEIDRFWA